MPPKRLVISRKKECTDTAVMSIPREKTVSFPSSPPAAPATTRQDNMSVDRWFASRFAVPRPYLHMGNEFRAMEKKSGNWEMMGPRQENSFVRTATGGGSMRRITVNANIVGGGDYPTYVACEGPTQESVYDFWTLVWQEGVNRILSVNFPFEERLYEQGYAKETAQYWPIVEGETVSFMPFKLTCVETNLMAGPGKETSNEEDMVYRITRLVLHHENNILTEEPTREIIHMCYYRWPDARIPIPWCETETTRDATMNLILAVEKEMRRTDTPLLVHCHAGIGRTGVIISTDMALKQLRANNTVNIRKVVEQLRSKRPRSVMNQWQYALIHLIVAEVAKKERLMPPTIDSQPVEILLEQVWVEVEKEVKLFFGDELITYSPELMKE